MAEEKADLKAIQEELKWIDVESYSQRRSRQGLLDFIIPFGCIFTAGVLTFGLYSFYKKDSRTQQRMMRLRVLSQAVTASLAVFGIFYVNRS